MQKVSHLVEAEQYLHVDALGALLPHLKRIKVVSWHHAFAEDRKLQDLKKLKADVDKFE